MARQHLRYTECCDLPFYQLHYDKITSISTVVEDQAIGAGGFELEKQVHRGVCLQRSQRQVTSFTSKSYRVGDDVAHAETGVELAIGDVTVLALVEVGHAVDHQSL